MIRTKAECSIWRESTEGARRKIRNPRKLYKEFWEGTEIITLK